MPIEPTQVSRILIVDDDEDFRVSHAAMIKAHGHVPEIASDGFEALAKLIMEIDLVLLDADMPHMDGFEVARRIRSDPVHTHLPIVMVTGLTSSEDRIRALETGINDFINKPVDPYELQLRVKWLLELKRAHDALARHGAELEATVERRTEALRSALEDVSQAKRSTHEAHLDTIRRLTIAAEYRDMVTASHIERIGLYSALLAEALGMSPGFIDDIRHAAAMHDVGKIGIPDAVLLKQGSLTQDERTVMESHTTSGRRRSGGTWRRIGRSWHCPHDRRCTTSWCVTIWCRGVDDGCAGGIRVDPIRTPRSRTERGRPTSKVSSRWATGSCATRSPCRTCIRGSSSSVGVDPM